MRKFGFLAGVAVAAIALSGCSTSSNDTQSASAGSDGVVTLKVGASPSPHAKILEYIQDNLAADNGLNLDIVQYTDYVQPNEALNSGELDANYYQTVPYLESESASRGYQFTSGEGIHLEPLGIYSNSLTDLAALPEGGKVGVISDPSNQARALQLLADQGLVELPASGEASVANVKKLKNFDLVEVEGPQLVRSLPDVDLAVINGNFAQEGGLVPSKDALVLESPENNPAVNILVWKDGTDKAAAVKQLEELLHSDQVREYIESEWTDGSVIPAF